VSPPKTNGSNCVGSTSLDEVGSIVPTDLVRRAVDSLLWDGLNINTILYVATFVMTLLYQSTWESKK